MRINVSLYDFKKIILEKIKFYLDLLIVKTITK